MSLQTNWTGILQRADKSSLAQDFMEAQNSISVSARYMHEYLNAKKKKKKSLTAPTCSPSAWLEMCQKILWIIHKAHVPIDVNIRKLHAQWGLPPL